MLMDGVPGAQVYFEQFPHGLELCFAITELVSRLRRRGGGMSFLFIAFMTWFSHLCGVLCRRTHDRIRVIAFAIGLSHAGVCLHVFTDGPAFT